MNQKRVPPKKASLKSVLPRKPRKTPWEIREAFLRANWRTRRLYSRAIELRSRLHGLPLLHHEKFERESAILEEEISGLIDKRGNIHAIQENAPGLIVRAEKLLSAIRKEFKRL